MTQASAEEKAIIGIDIGSTHVSVVAATGESILGTSWVHNSGMRKGTMVALEAVADAVADAVDEVERQTGLSITEARVSVAGLGARSENFTQAVHVKNNEVRDTDIQRLMNNVKAQKPESGFEVIHDILGYFILDGKPGIISPEGMWGSDLSAIYHRVIYPQAELYNVLRACNAAGVKVQGFVLESLAAAQAVIDDDERELGIASVNVGSELTHVSVFSSGVPIFCKDYPLGSHHITKDLAVGLRTTQAEAERIKREYGSACYLPQELREVTFLQTLESTRRQVTKGEISQIIEPRVREIFTTVRDDLEKLKIHSLLTKGIVLSGGGSLLPGLCILAEDSFDLQSRIGLPLKIAGLTEGLRSPNAAVSVGLTSSLFSGVHSTNVGRNYSKQSASPLSFARNLFSKVRDSFR